MPNTEETIVIAKANTTKSDIGLGNVDNTSDANKPLSSADTIALAAKVPTSTTVNGHALSSNVMIVPKDINPYTSYQAIVSQSSTSAPSATVKLNELGVTLNWGRTSAGLYTITAASGTPFSANKTVIILSNPTLSLVNYILVVTSTTVITMTTILASVIATVLTAVATDALLNNTLIEIRVYS